MIVALTGTPGTGKSSVAGELEDGFRVIDITELVEEKGLGERKKELEIDVDELVEALEEEIDTGEDVLIEGHLSHHFPADLCVVLRCSPEELGERLEERGYSEEKVEENIESEILDVILSEAVGKQDNVIELDTTGRSVEEVAEETGRRIREGETGYGEIDWTDRL